MKRKICIVTGSRAEYGLLRGLMEEIRKDKALKLQLVVSSAHLSPEFDLSYKSIEKDGFKIDEKVEMLLSSDTPVGVTKSMGLGLISFSEVYERIKPDVVVLLGDRFETFAAAQAAAIAGIPIAHLYGGEATFGAIDESMRHSITKMSHLHFTATEEYRERVIQLGEPPKRVFTVGSIGLDGVKKLKLLSKENFERKIDFKLNKHNFLITFHPVTLERNTSGQQFNNLLNVLDSLKDTHLVFTKANADTFGRIINKMIAGYVAKNCHKSVFFTSMDRERCLSAMKFVDGVVGNSSSGLIETPYFKKGTINIGSRQEGRLKPVSVIDCAPNERSIERAFAKLYSRKFRKGLEKLKNPYDSGGMVSLKIKNIIKSVNLDNIVKKTFYNLKNKGK